MTYFYYKTNTWSNEPQVSKETKNLWKEYAKKTIGELRNYLMVFIKQNSIMMIPGKA